MVLWAGDGSGDGTLKYTGAGNDRDPHPGGRGAAPRRTMCSAASTAALRHEPGRQRGIHR